MSYWRFAAMIATSTVVMFGLMYLNTYALDHVLWSETRTWMALMMGATMAVVMLGFMLGMYQNKAINIAIFAGAAVVFSLSLWLVRSQVTVSDEDYLRAMVPHHSIAILTSERARISDPRVRKLADEIIEAQRREIAEMKYLVEDLEAQPGGPPARLGPEAPPRVVPAPEAIQQANIAEVDPGELDEAEIDEVLGPGPRCSFRYSRTGPPVVAAGTDTGRGVVKLHGRLVEVTAAGPDAGASARGGVTLSADGIEIVVEPRGGTDEALREAAARMHLAAGLTVGYVGYYACDPPPRASL